MVTLKNFLARAGMIWPQNAFILKRQRRDAAVFYVLREMVTITNASRQLTNTSTRAVDETLASIFSDALDPPVLQILTEQHSPLDFLAALRLSNPVAARLCEPHFFQLFEVLVEARLAWKASPRLPFDVNEHCRMAKAIDKFLQQAPNWTNADLAIYEVVGGYDSDDEDNDQAVDEATMAMERMEVDDEEEKGRDEDHPVVENTEEGYDEAMGEITRGVDDMDIDE